MSAAAIAAKVASAVLSSEKGRKTAGTVILVILVVLLTPVLAIAALFSSGISFDTSSLADQVVAQMSAEQQARMEQINAMGIEIENAMRDAGFGVRYLEAHVLFLLALSDHMGEEDFVSRLVSCFAANQTDSQLIAAVNAEFGTEIDVEDFTHVMNGIRSVYIDTSNYVDLSMKNNLDLVEFAKEAERTGWGYVWGTYGLILTEERFNAKLEQYPDDIGEHEEFIRSHWIGRRTADCGGLIKAYGWLDPDTHEISYGTNGFTDYGANGMYYAAPEKGSIETIPEIPGLAVWHEGHIGIYIGNGEVIEAMGTRYGVVKTVLANGSWTDWLKIPGITYIEVPESPAPTDTTETEEP
jgi:hypothetical protein